VVVAGVESQGSFEVIEAVEQERDPVQLADWRITGVETERDPRLLGNGEDLVDERFVGVPHVGLGDVVAVGRLVGRLKLGDIERGGQRPASNRVLAGRSDGTVGGVGVNARSRLAIAILPMAMKMMIRSPYRSVKIPLGY
jgi:hypothetical protein